MIRIESLDIGYSDTLVKVRQLSLEAGKIYAVIAQNGKGKTTFLKTINGLVKPLQGNLSINNKDFFSLNRTAISRQIAYVSSRFEGIDQLSVFEYVSLGRTPYLGLLGNVSEKDRSLIQKILNDLNIGHLSDKQTSRISDGERQMTSIARALAQNTPVITLDEPTAFLDYINKIRFVRELISIAKDQNKCVLISTHDIDLCLEEQIPILYIDPSNCLKQFNGTDKQELIQLAFSSTD
jgi:iron complex transport system ATP-binding protein